MLVKLAREEVRLKQQGVRYINQELQKCFPEYSIESIKGQRNKKTRYAQLLAEEYANADTVLETQTVQASTDSIVIEELVAIRRQMDLSLIFGEEVTDMNVAIDRGVLDTSLERLFPAVRKSNSGGANRQEVDLGDPSVTLTSHRRRLYKRVQRMFCRDRKRLMSGILQDSLEIKDSIPEGAEEFWTELLGRESPVDVPEYNDPHARLDGLMDPISEAEVVKYLSRKSSGAPGPDGLTWRMLKEDKVKEPTSLFNLWLYLGSVPSRICEGRTTLIPKAPGTADPSQ
ncbi:hypothetical protein EB796_014611 [Bugula neritina]|uniref:Uncharacterized protein n=1 Tax=Bugula neritina TaxID=10212 RepID=A0A7J7JLY4_BUGNE|nr:hypothetical protein EB796_014611 [Bugula neritina]